MKLEISFKEARSNLVAYQEILDIFRKKNRKVSKWYYFIIEGGEMTLLQFMNYFNKFPRCQYV